MATCKIKKKKFVILKEIFVTELRVFMVSLKAKTITQTRCIKSYLFGLFGMKFLRKT